MFHLRTGMGLKDLRLQFSSEIFPHEKGRAFLEIILSSPVRPLIKSQQVCEQALKGYFQQV